MIIVEIIQEFISLTILVIPFFLLGTIFGALLEAYLKPDFALKYLNKGIFSVINASLLGAILPGCACATMPMADGLKKRGSALGTIAAFILVSPLLSPQTVILTYGMLGFEFAFARVVFAIAGAILIGIIFNYLESKNVKGFVLSAKSEDDECKSCSSDTEVEKVSFWESFFKITKDLGKYFILGMFIASVLTVLIPEEAIPKYIGSSGVFAYVVAVFAGIPLYVCEGEEIPLTLALLKLGLGEGPSMAFLLGSVGTCLPTMIMAQKIIGKRPTILYVIGWFVFAISSGLLFSLLS